MSKENIYALYKGDKFITEGTKKEIAEYTGLKVKTLSFYGTNAYLKRVRPHKHYKGFKELIKIQEV